MGSLGLMMVIEFQVGIQNLIDSIVLKRAKMGFERNEGKFEPKLGSFRGIK